MGALTISITAKRVPAATNSGDANSEDSILVTGINGTRANDTPVSIQYRFTKVYNGTVPDFTDTKWIDIPDKSIFYPSSTRYNVSATYLDLWENDTTRYYFGSSKNADIEFRAISGGETVTKLITLEGGFHRKIIDIYYDTGKPRIDIYTKELNVGLYNPDREEVQATNWPERTILSANGRVKCTGIDSNGDVVAYTAPGGGNLGNAYIANGLVVGDTAGAHKKTGGDVPAQGEIRATIINTGALNTSSLTSTTGTTETQNLSINGTIVATGNIKSNTNLYADGFLSTEGNIYTSGYLSATAGVVCVSNHGTPSSGEIIAGNITSYGNITSSGNINSNSDIQIKNRLNEYSSLKTILKLLANKIDDINGDAHGTTLPDFN